MKREIKFRAFHDGQMLYEDWSNHNVFRTVGDILKFDTAMQYTGLKDKNGVEIYEGDIVRINNQYRRFPDDELQDLLITTEIVFNNGAFWFRGGGYTDCNWHHYDDRQVIGNIYKNPELLETPEKTL